MISGNDLLIKHNKIIYDFYNDNRGLEFVGYQHIDKVTNEQIERIKYYHFFNSNRRNKYKIVRAVSNKVYYNLLRIERMLRINRLKNIYINIRKGANWFSITNDLAKYVISKEKEIKKMYKHTNCADEIFLQTITYNSKFRDKLFNKYHNEHDNIKRFIDWNRGKPYVFTLEDYNEIVNCNCFFARKFSSERDKDIIDKIYEYTIK